uniref:Putative methyltransferase n=1 Tax=viral metagenome TaxID=1070528 RepID=A0A6M3LNX8_9ZZZZ
MWLDWSVDPADNGKIPRIATKIKNRVNRLKAIGNGQCPPTAATAWKILTNE